MNSRGAAGRAILDRDPIARGDHGVVEGRTGIAALAQHDASLGPDVGVGLGDHSRADAAIGSQALPDEVKLIAGTPDIRPATLDGPGASAQRLAASRRGATYIRATPARRTDRRGRWLASRQADGVEGDRTQRRRI